jgi:hypothetical protein
MLNSNIAPADVELMRRLAAGDHVEMRKREAHARHQTYVSLSWTIVMAIVVGLMGYGSWRMGLTQGPLITRLFADIGAFGAICLALTALWSRIGDVRYWYARS